MDTRRLIVGFLGVVWLGAGCASIEERDERVAASGVRYHTVRSGESLSTIASRYGTSATALALENRVANPDLIKAGRRLRIPGRSRGGKAARSAGPVPTGPAKATGRFAWPVRGTVVRGYGTPMNGLAARGIAIAASRGTPVKAADGGRVVLASDHLRGYGKTVAVDHGNGYTTVYAHNAELLVRRGESVRKGEEIARVGSSGRATRSQLEFRLYRHGKPLDPRRYLR